MVCEHIGEPNPDIAGIGVLVSFAVQALLSIALTGFVFFLSKLGRLEINDNGREEDKVGLARLRIVSNVMTTGNDIQVVLGIALVITALVDIQTIDLYHLRLIYDLVSFVGVGVAACAITWTYTSVRVSRYRSHKPNRVSRWSPRHRSLYLFAVLYCVLVIWLGVRLGKWDDANEGHCYRTDRLSGSDSHHPTSDIVYLAVTSIWSVGVLLLGALGSETQIRRVIIGAILQYPVHLYFMIVIRLANSDALDGTESESDWEFGQTTAVILLGTTLVEVISAIIEYVNFERRVEANEDLEDIEIGGDAKPSLVESTLGISLTDGVWNLRQRLRRSRRNSRSTNTSDTASVAIPNALGEEITAVETSVPNANEKTAQK